MADVSLLDTVPKIIGIAAVCTAVLGALIQYIINSRAEHRQREAANLQSDIEVSKIFSELIEVANGYGGRSEPQERIIDIINSSLPPNLLTSVIANDPRDIGRLFSGSIIPSSTALARQLAAAESIVNLAIKYPILLEPALVGLDVTAGFSPFAKEAFNRLVKYYKINRALTDWGPNWKGYARRHTVESETEAINTNNTG